MKKAVLLIFLVVSALFCQPVLAMEVVVERPEISVAEFSAILAKAEGADEVASLTLTALMVLSVDRNRGEKMLVQVLHPRVLHDGKISKDMDFHLQRLQHRPFYIKSYILGTTPSNLYELPEGPLKMGFTFNRQISANKIKMMITCSGADNPRPLGLEGDGLGHWRIAEISSLMLGVKTY